MKVPHQLHELESLTLIVNLAQKRRVLAAAAAAGVSVAFGSPLGGVLFGLEGNLEAIKNILFGLMNGVILELDTFANESDVMWRGFVASAIAAVSLQWVNPFGTAKLVLFQVSCKLLKSNWLNFTFPGYLRV
jgi:chloride channel 3/4/5